MASEHHPIPVISEEDDALTVLAVVVDEVRHASALSAQALLELAWRRVIAAMRRARHPSVAGEDDYAREASSTALSS